MLGLLVLYRSEELGGQIKPLAPAEGFAKLGRGIEKLDDGLALLLGGSLRFSQQRDADLLLDSRRLGGKHGVDGIANTLHCFSPP